MEKLRKLLRKSEHVSNINKLDDSGMSALHYAARANNFEAVALLIKQGDAGKWPESTFCGTTEVLTI